MLRRPEQRPKMFYLAALLMVILTLHALFIGSSFFLTNVPRVKYDELKDSGLPKQENSTNARAPILNETEENQQAADNITQENVKEVFEEESERGSTTQTVAANNVGWSIYTTTSDLGVYSDDLCTNTTISTDLGVILPGGSVTVMFYVKNSGVYDLTLSLQPMNWTPPTADGPLTLTWNLEGSVLSTQQVEVAVLTLIVSPDIQGITTFSFDVVISGSEIGSH